MTQQSTPHGVTAAQAQQAYGRPCDHQFITDREVARMLGASRSGVWKWYSEGRFPAPIKLSARCTRWRLSEVQAWMADPQAWQAGEG